MSVEKEEEQPWRDSYDQLYKQYRDLEKKFALLLAYLIDKKILGEEFGKTFQQTVKKGNIDTNELVQWYITKKKK